MKRGGYATGSDTGSRLEYRDALYDRMMDFGEGGLFRMEDIAVTSQEERDFVEMRNHDYIHIIDGYCTAIIETDYLRRLPKLDLFLHAYTNLRNCQITETGDRVAWRLQLKEFEPIKGYRLYSTGPSEVLSYGHMRLQMLPATPWLMDDRPAARIFRAFHDMDPKERTTAIKRIRELTQIPTELYTDALAWVDEQDFGDEVPGDLEPYEVADFIRKCLARDDAKT